MAEGAREDHAHTQGYSTSPRALLGESGLEASPRARGRRALLGARGRGDELELRGERAALRAPLEVGVRESRLARVESSDRARGDERNEVGARGAHERPPSFG